MPPIELHRRIANLEKVLGQKDQDIKSLKRKVHELHQALAAPRIINNDIDIREGNHEQDGREESQGNEQEMDGAVVNVPCCCQELQEIQREKQVQLMKLSEHWRKKAETLAAEYQPKMTKLKSQQVNLYQSAHFEIKQMKQYLEAVIKNILKKQQDIVNIYESRLNNEKKENRQLVKRIIKQRYASSSFKSGTGSRPGISYDQHQSQLVPERDRQGSSKQESQKSSKGYRKHDLNYSSNAELQKGAESSLTQQQPQYPFSNL